MLFWFKALHPSRFARKYLKMLRFPWDSWSFWSFNGGFGHVCKQAKKITVSGKKVLKSHKHPTGRRTQAGRPRNVLTWSADSDWPKSWIVVGICFSLCLIGWYLVDKLDLLDITSRIYWGTPGPRHNYHQNYCMFLRGFHYYWAGKHPNVSIQTIL